MKDKKQNNTKGLKDFKISVKLEKLQMVQLTGGECNDSSGYGVPVDR